MNRVAVVVGNPKPNSRTLHAALRLADRLGAVEPLVVDLGNVGPGLLDWADPTVGRLVDEVAASALVIAASPTYKASHTGLLKLFLDRFSTDSLRGAVGVPLMLGAGPAHQLAAEHALRPLLTELGASVTTSGLYLLEREYDAPDAFDAWLDRNRRALACTGLPIPFPTGAPA